MHNTIIEVTITTATNRWSATTVNTTTIKEFMENENINYNSCVVHLDGMPLSTDELNTTFEEQGVTESCMLAAIIKAVNA